MFAPVEGLIQVRELQLISRIGVFCEACGKPDMRSDMPKQGHKRLGT